MSHNKNEALLMASLDTFYRKPEHISALISIIDGRSRVSLRLIDWFVTNYAKKNNTIIIQETKNGKEYFNVYINYRAQLKAFTKHLFDPFRRRERIMYMLDKDSKASIITTIGQMAFFRWAIENNIIAHLSIDENIAKVEKDISLSQKANEARKNKNDQAHVHKRIPVSCCSSRSMTTYNGNLVVTFE